MFVCFVCSLISKRMSLFGSTPILIFSLMFLNSKKDHLFTRSWWWWWWWWRRVRVRQLANDTRQPNTNLPLPKRLSLTRIHMVCFIFPIFWPLFVVVFENQWNLIWSIYYWIHWPRPRRFADICPKSQCNSMDIEWKELKLEFETIDRVLSIGAIINLLSTQWLRPLLKLMIIWFLISSLIFSFSLFLPHSIDCILPFFPIYANCFPIKSSSCQKSLLERIVFGIVFQTSQIESR